MHDAILQKLLKTTVLHHPVPGYGSSNERFLMLIRFFVVEGICSVEPLFPVQQRVPQSQAHCHANTKIRGFEMHVPSSIHTERTLQNSLKKSLITNDLSQTISNAYLLPFRDIRDVAQFHLLFLKA